MKKVFEYDTKGGAVITFEHVLEEDLKFLGLGNEPLDDMYITLENEYPDKTFKTHIILTKDIAIVLANRILGTYKEKV